MTFLRPLALAAFALCLATGSSFANVTETFDYPNGPLIPNGGWANQSGTAGTLLVDNGQAVVSQDSGSEDAELVFANDLNTGSITAVFDISVSAAAITGSDFEYFAHFSDDTDLNFLARVDVVTPNGSGDYTLGLSSDSSTNEVALPVDFAFGDTVSIELTFDLDAGLASLTAGGSSVDSTTVVMGELIDTFNLRQSNSSSDETILVDNLSITFSKAIPEPSTAAVLGLGLVAGLIRRRR